MIVVLYGIFWAIRQYLSYTVYILSFMKKLLLNKTCNIIDLDWSFDNLGNDWQTKQPNPYIELNLYSRSGLCRPRRNGGWRFGRQKRLLLRFRGRNNVPHHHFEARNAN